MSKPESDTIWTATSWSVVSRAGSADQKVANEAWTRLIGSYEEPVRRGIRRLLRGHAATEEILAEFPGYLLEHELLPRADREVGRFRCYVQGVLRRFVLDALRRRTRGFAEEIDENAVFDPASPDVEEQDEAVWAETVLANATRACAGSGTRDAQILLRLHGVAPFEQQDRDSLCEEFSLTRNALNQALHRGRQELRCLVLEQVRDTVQSPGDLHDEMTMIVQRLIDARPGLIQSADPTG